MNKVYLVWLCDVEGLVVFVSLSKDKAEEFCRNHKKECYVEERNLDCEE